ncbi:MAG: aminotransferase class IV [Puniceicoccales bacterium]
MNEEFLIWNGELSPVDSIAVNPRSEGWLYGYGSFETMGLESGQIRFWKDHWERLKGTMEAMGCRPPFSPEQIEEAVALLSQANHCGQGIARLSWHRNGASVDWMLRVFSPPPTPASWVVGIAEVPHPGLSPLSGWKTNNYLLNLHAYQAGRAQGWDEALLCRNGRIIEGTRSNVWGWQDGMLFTPPLSEGPLPGVVRKRILAVAGSCGMVIRERVLAIEELPSLKGFFLSNANLILRPVSQLGDYSFATNFDWLEPLRREIGRGASSMG